MNDRVAQFRGLYQRHRIKDQREFYEGRQHEYESAARQAVTARNALLFLAALAGVGSQLTSGSARGLCGVLSAALASMAAALTAFEALIGFAPLQKLYGDAARNLQEAEDDWSDAEPDADLGAQVERVEQIFRTENGQWGQLVVEGAAQNTQVNAADS